MSAKLRVLTLHGHGQNAEVFRRKSGALRKGVSRLVEFHHLDGPRRVEDDEDASAPAAVDGTDDGPARRSWYRYGAGDEALLSSVRDSLQAVDNAFVRHGPFHGVLGFSQGASLAALTASLTSPKDTAQSSSSPRDAGALAAALNGLLANVRLDFVCMIAGYVPRRMLRELCVERGSELPSFHCFGDADAIIRADDSRELVQLFPKRGATVVNHPQGHLVPAHADVRGAFRDFIEQQHGRIQPSKR